MMSPTTNNCTSVQSSYYIVIHVVQRNKNSKTYLVIKIKKLQRPGNNLEYIQISSVSQNDTPVKTYYHSKREKKRSQTLLGGCLVIWADWCSNITHNQTNQDDEQLKTFYRLHLQGRIKKIKMCPIKTLPIKTSSLVGLSEINWLRKLEGNMLQVLLTY